jgi:hypothetical protein
VGCSLQGTLAHAKNGDEVFWKEKFHAANGKAQACIQGALSFFFLCFRVRGGGRKDFFSIFSTSQCGCTMFLSSSQWVPNIFPNIFSVPLHFYMPWKMVSSFHLYRWAKGEELYSSKQSLPFWGISIISFFLEWWANQISMLPKKKTWEALHLINRRGDYFPKFISLPLA